MSRCIQNVDMMILVVEREHSGSDRDASLLFHFHPIRPRQLMPSSSSTNRTGLLDGTSIQEQFFGKSRLPSIRVGNDGQIPPLGNLVSQGRFHARPIQLLRLTADLCAHSRPPRLEREWLVDIAVADIQSGPFAPCNERRSQNKPGIRFHGLQRSFTSLLLASVPARDEPSSNTHLAFMRVGEFRTTIHSGKVRDGRVRDHSCVSD
mmetsp:Transcript_14771/g.60012  ORF Transcript_14771/g.60012 Transcript_14771/m.60012 type:complete len:206 (-) Transcript_14771:47-664(-)